MSRAPEVIRTARLMLRPPRMDDAQRIFEAYAQDPEVTRYLSWRPHESIHETREFVRGCMQAWERGSRFPWVITRITDGAVIGMIDLTLSWYLGSIGYVLARPHWGKGYMTEAAQAVVDAAFSLPDVSKVNAMCDVENVASARVLEKIGMVREAQLARFAVHPGVSDEPRDVFVYAKGTSPTLVSQ